jgi:hypothetical protein
MKLGSQRRAKWFNLNADAEGLSLDVPPGFQTIDRVAMTPVSSL